MHPTSPNDRSTGHFADTNLISNFEDKSTSNIGWATTHNNVLNQSSP